MTNYTVPSLDRVSRFVPGKSDPFVVFSLNGQKVYKSQTKKKTVDPDWNEQFVVQVVCIVFTLQ